MEHAIDPSIERLAIRDHRFERRGAGWHPLRPPAWDAGGGPVDEED